MRTKLLLVIIQLIFCLRSFSQDVWINKASLPDGHGRQDDLSFSVGTLGFVGLGYNNELWCYDPSSDTWAAKNNFPGSFRSGAFGFNIGMEIFFGGGNELNDFWKYNIESNEWTRLNNLPVPVKNGVGLSIENKGYLVSENQVWEFDPVTMNWNGKNNFPGTIRRQTTAITINNKGYLAFGKDETYGGLADLWEYDPHNDSWLKRSDCPVPRFSAYGFSLNNKGYFGGGYREWYGSDLSDFYEYDPSSDVWSIKNSPGRSYGAAAFSTSNGTGYYGFGNITCHIGDCSPSNTFRAYLPASVSSINEEHKDKISFSVFPNPTNNSLTLSVFSPVENEVSINVINEFGQMIFAENKTKVLGKYLKTIDLSKQSKGIYFLEIRSNDERRTERIILN